MKERIINILLILVFRWTVSFAIVQLDIKVYPLSHFGHPYRVIEPYEIQDHSDIVESKVKTELPTSLKASTTLEPPTYKDLAPIKPQKEEVLDPEAAKAAIIAALKEVEKKDRTTVPQEDNYSRNFIKDRVQDYIYGPESKSRQFKWFKELYKAPAAVKYQDDTHIVAGHVDYPGIIFKKYKKPIKFEINIPTVTIAEVPEWARA